MSEQSITLQAAAATGAPIPRPADVWHPPPLVAAAVDQACKVAARRARGEETPLPTPWPEVNRSLHGGLWPGLYTLTSTTGVGKTQWTLQCALEAAAHVRDERLRRGEAPIREDGAGDVLVVALELGEVDIGTRMLGLLSGDAVAWRDLFFGHVSEDTIAALAAEHHATLASLPLRFACVSPLGAAEPGTMILRSPDDLGRVVAQMRPRLLILDYVQLLPGEDERQEVRHAIKRAAIVGREAARKHGAAVVYVSSTARGNYERIQEGGIGTGDPGRLVDLGKEAGELEFCADAALVLAPEATDGAESPDDRIVWFAVAKGRGFGRAWIPLCWNGRRFAQCSEEQRREAYKVAVERAKPPRREAPSGKGNGQGNGYERAAERLGVKQ